MLTTLPPPLLSVVRSSLTVGKAHLDPETTKQVQTALGNTRTDAEGGMLVRVVVCGKVGKVKREEMGGMAIENIAMRSASFKQISAPKFFKQFQGTPDIITGLHLVFNNTWIHIVEAAIKTTTALLADAHLGDDTKVLMIIDDIQERWFPFWASRVITRKPTDSVANELPEVLIADLCCKLAILGHNFTSKKIQTNLKATLDELGDKHIDLLPTNERLERLVSSEEVLNTATWSAVYNQPMTMEVEEDFIVSAY